MEAKRGAESALLQKRVNIWGEGKMGAGNSNKGVRA